MIKAQIGERSASWERRLSDLARRIAIAQLALRKPGLRATGAHWRDARLLWPEFTEER